MGLLHGSYYACMDCLQESCMAVGLDKRGRLYTRCLGCGTITFRYSDMALRGLRDVWGVALTLDDIRKRIASGLALPVAHTVEVRR